MGTFAHFFPAIVRLAAGAAVFSWSISAFAEPVKVQGPASLTKGLSELTSSFRDAGLDVRIDSASGNTSVISALGQQSIDVAIMSRALTAQEKSRFPTRRFFEIVIAAQAYVPAVARDVWEGGVRTITKEQMQKIFEGKVTKWSELGGGEGEIKFFNPEPGNPAADLLTTWLYEDPRRAPASPAEVVQGGGEAVRNSIEFTNGSISLTPPSLTNGKSIFALGIADANGKVLQALEDNLLDRSYPLGRPIFLVFGDRPSGKVKDFLDFLRSPEGRELLIRADFTPVTLKDLQ